MKIEIWSDVQCPFCYIGKRHLEIALDQLKPTESIEIEWKSYQLDPTIPADLAPQNSFTYLAAKKGMTIEQSIAMHENVTQMAAKAGLNYQLEKTIISNSYNAHQLIHLAKTIKKGDEMEEILFDAYFCQGKNIGNIPTLIELGEQIGLTESAIVSAITTNQFGDRINREIQESQQIGVKGVPFFVFDRKYALSGAQPVEQFVNCIQQLIAEKI
ncbi:MAG: DsbA family oxidoreductase [Crocinitomicaceae bacterium]|nr:DsbA family oxidoreductase [Crocinitomicaceae bacterium]